MADVDNHHRRLHRLDLVRFDSVDGESKHGELGLVVSYTEPKAKVIMCIDGVVVDKSGVTLAVVDRSSLHPGMHVTSASDPTGQIGVVTAVSSSVDLVNDRPSGDYSDIAATSSKRRGVSPATLKRVTGFSLGDYVVNRQRWLGRVVEVCVAVDVAFDDGAVCRVTGATPLARVVDVDVARGCRREVNCKFYPGQRVTGHHMLNELSFAFKEAKWLRGYWKQSREQGTVVKVNVTAVIVVWIASAELGTGKDLVNASAPPAQQNPEDLTIFCSDNECPWALGDRCFLPESQRSQRIPRRQSTDVPTDTSLPLSPPAMTATEKENDNDRKVSAAAVAAPEKGQKPYRNKLRKFFYKRDRRGTRWGARMPAMEKTAVVAGTATTADVMWQDGTLTRGVASVGLVPFDILNAHEFFPGQHVVVGLDDDDATPAAARARRVGVVRTVDPKDQTVRVSWLDAGGEEECVASAYDLRRCTEHDVFYGDVVIRKLPATAAAAEEGGGFDMSWVGRVVDVRDGHVQVRWGDSEASTALHHEVIGVEMVVYWQLEYEVGPWLNDRPAAANNNNNAANNNVAAVAGNAGGAAGNNNVANVAAAAGNAGGAAGGNNVANVAAAAGNNNVANVVAAAGNARSAGANAPAQPPPPPPPATLTGRVGAAMQSMIDVASQLLAQGKSYLVGESSSSSSTSSSAAEIAVNDAESPPAAAPAAEEEASAPSAPAAGGDDGNGVAAEAVADVAVASSEVAGGDDAGDYFDRKGKKKIAGAGEDDSLGFAHFDVVQCPADHHYLDSKIEGTAHGNKWVKRVQKEWRILGDDNLPGTIYVRAYEDRMDLLRAAMVGADGTPYQDNLFLFDIHLPQSYPSTPPQVYYHSFGHRVNPNLYPSGTVCLSLLGTFDAGDETERWLPDKSTLLQVLVSIQGLILTVDPYYNEAGYDTYVGTAEGRRNAVSYAENAFLLTLRSTLCLLRRPPCGFEEIVVGHFRRRGRQVLAACEACRVRGVGVAGDGDERVGCSAGFRIALGNVVPLLVDAFTAIGPEGIDQFT
uniref:UBC core domain-containing protein n=1 Tax=Leersia perrieri TaxID=77586 RepID=A0A0D9WCY7_9ORYZ